MTVQVMLADRPHLSLVNHQLGDMALRFLKISEGGREAIAGYLIEAAEQW